jgi:hypothetical protein
MIRPVNDSMVMINIIADDGTDPRHRNHMKNNQIDFPFCELSLPLSRCTSCSNNKARLRKNPRSRRTTRSPDYIYTFLGSDRLAKSASRVCRSITVINRTGKLYASWQLKTSLDLENLQRISETYRHHNNNIFHNCVSNQSVTEDVLVGDRYKCASMR